jgi:hypothetical protein
VIVGRTHVRQLILEGDLQRGETMPRDQGLEIREMRFSPTTVAQMAEFDLRRLALPAGPKVAIFHRPEFKQMAECAAAWSGRGLDATSHGFDGLAPVVQHPILDESPLADFARPLAWLAQAVPPGRASNTTVNLPVVVLQPPGCVDTPMKFGPENKLFGMLCRPERGRSDDLVLIPNGGRDPSFGAARQHVVLARRLAQAGIASFRFDFGGLGDSVGPPGRERVFPHAFTDRVADTKAALDAMSALGFSRFSMHGLCLGAYHALYGALADERLSRLMLINLPLFTVPTSNALGELRAARTIGEVLSLQDAAPARLGQSAGRPLDLAMLKRAALVHLRRHTIGRLQGLMPRLGLARTQSFAHRAMTALSRRGVRTLFLFSNGPQDIEAFAAEFGADAAGLRDYPGAEMRIVPGMDHSLTVTTGRVPAETMMVEFVAAGRRAAEAAAVAS